jgi:site-specific recombinase XerD
MSDPSRVRITGPLVGHAAGFRAALEARGYRHHAVGCQLYVMAHLSRWLESEGLDAVELTPDRIERFLVARREAGYTLWLSTKGVAPLVDYLRGVGVVPLPEPVVAKTPAERCLAVFRTYLLEERGLAEGTVTADVHVAGLFLATRPADDLGLARLTPSEIVEFVRSQCERRGAANVTTGLRAFLRFCHVTGLTPRPLGGAVPKVASWRLATLPKVVDPAIVKALLASCDRRTTRGRRDFAVLVLLARLGLRAGEVTSLLLGDIDWRAGEVLIRGKGPRLDRLPLPADVGEAVAAWLRRGRPRCPAREVITRVRAPHGPLTAGGIAAIVHAACLRAGVDHINAHRLRHTAATEMLRAGAGLVEIGQVLRHRSVFTTAIYAKVDRAGLRGLASPWPGSSGQAVTR